MVIDQFPCRIRLVSSEIMYLLANVFSIPDVPVLVLVDLVAHVGRCNPAQEDDVFVRLVGGLRNVVTGMVPLIVFVSFV